MKKKELIIQIALAVLVGWNFLYFGHRAIKVWEKKIYTKAISDVNERAIYFKGINDAVNQVAAQVQKNKKVVINTNNGPLILIPEPNNIGGMK